MAENKYRMSPGALAAQRRMRTVSGGLRKTLLALPGYQRLVEGSSPDERKAEPNATRKKAR